MNNDQQTLKKLAGGETKKNILPFFPITLIQHNNLALVHYGLKLLTTLVTPLHQCCSDESVKRFHYCTAQAYRPWLLLCSTLRGLPGGLNFLLPPFQQTQLPPQQDSSSSASHALERNLWSHFLISAVRYRAGENLTVEAFRTGTGIANSDVARSARHVVHRMLEKRVGKSFTPTHFHSSPFAPPRACAAGAQQPLR